MAKLLRRSRDDEAAATPTPAPDAMAPAAEAAPEERATSESSATTGNAAADYEPMVAAEPPRPSGGTDNRAPGGLLGRVLGDPGEQSAAERERQAQLEFEQAIAPVMDLMRAAVPGASTPEEAARILSANQPEPPRDTGGGAYVPGDAFDHDARVYYRLLRRDYEKNPRPSQKQKVSHHLHAVYGKLSGTKGW